MSIATIQSRCECQAKLRAQVNEAGRVVGGEAEASGRTVKAPATGVNAGADYFQIGWLCPHCGRNVSRSIFKGSLVYSAA